jgi:putative spermidine/putrescine transport system substrate-binding protein/spermidine/putrescine transport system substrate-binding protein
MEGERMKGDTSRRSAVLVGLAVLGTVMAAVQPTEAAGAVTLKVAAWEGYAGAKTAAGFAAEYKKKTGVTVTVVQAHTMQTNDELLNVINAKGIDIISPTSDWTKAFIRKGLVQPINVAAIPNYTKVSPSFRNSSDLSEGGKVYGVPLDYGNMVLSYDSKAFPTPPASWSVLADPKYKGKVTLWDDATTGIALGAQMAGLRNLYTLSDADLAKAKAQLLKIRPNISSFWGTASDAAKLYTSGKAVVGNDWGLGVQQANGGAAKGRFGFTIPKEGSTAWIDAWMITRNCKNKDVAEAWINYTLSPKGQKAQADVSSFAPVNPEAVSLLSPVQVDQFRLNNRNWIFKLSLWKEIPNRAKYQTVWNQVKAGK